MIAKDLFHFIESFKDISTVVAGYHLAAIGFKIWNSFKGIPNFKPYRSKMVTSDHSADVFKAFDEVEQVFGDHQFA